MCVHAGKCAYVGIAVAILVQGQRSAFCPRMIGVLRDPSIYAASVLQITPPEFQQLLFDSALHAISHGRWEDWFAEVHDADGRIWRVDLALEQRGDDDPMDVGDHISSPEFSPEFSTHMCA